jgi:hypothetical protein
MVLSYLICLIFGGYYMSVLLETFSEKYYRSPITTKREFYFCLIPFYMWAKCIVQAFKDLD